MSDAATYLKEIEAEWESLACRNANGDLVAFETLERFIELAKARKRVGKSWQK